MAATHQRQVIYETVLALRDHPNPEIIYEKALRRIPSISLATVYKNLHVFLDSGMLREVSLHHGSMQIETNPRPHHHLVCTHCKKIEDLDENEFKPLELNKKRLRGFQVKRISVDVLGLYQACANRRS